MTQRSSDLTDLLQLQGGIRAMYASKNEARMLLQASHWVGYITDHPSVIQGALRGAYVAARQGGDIKLLQVLQTYAFQSADDGKERQKVLDDKLLEQLPPDVQSAEANNNSAANMTASQWHKAIQCLHSNAANTSKQLLQHAEQQVMSTMLRLWGLKNIYPVLQQIDACLRTYGYNMEVLAALMSQIRQVAVCHISNHAADAADATKPGNSIPWEQILPPDSDVSIRLESMRRQQLPRLPIGVLLQVLHLLMQATWQIETQAAYATEAKRCLHQRLLQQPQAQQPNKDAEQAKQAKLSVQVTQQQDFLEAQEPGFVL